MGKGFSRHKTKAQKQSIILFLMGFVFGIFLYLWKHNEVRSDKTYFIETILWRMGNYEIDVHTYFMFLLQKRMLLWFVLTVSATTFLGLCIIRLFFIWNGICFGGILSMYLYWYGGKGMIYLFFLLFPQMFCYIPAFVGLCYLLEKIYNKIYSNRDYGYTYAYADKGVERWNKLQKIMLYFGLLLVAIIGVVFESYVNPFVVKKIINFF